MAQRPNTEQDFWARVERGSPDACWTWRGTKRPDGYGVMRYNRHYWGAHQLAVLFVTGSDPRPMFVCHRCDNPPCCNPAHLFLGTIQDNTADMVARGRQARGDRHASRTSPNSLPRGDAHPYRLRPELAKRGADNPSARLSEADVRAIVELRRSGLTYKQIGARFGVAKSTIGALLTGETWAHLAVSHGK